MLYDRELPPSKSGFGDRVMVYSAAADDPMPFTSWEAGVDDGQQWREARLGSGLVVRVWKYHGNESAEVQLCRWSEEREASCGDGLDNDCDGLADGDDPDCTPQSGGGGTQSGDGGRGGASAGGSGGGRAATPVVDGGWGSGGNSSNISNSSSSGGIISSSNISSSNSSSSGSNSRSSNSSSSSSGRGGGGGGGGGGGDGGGGSGTDHAGRQQLGGGGAAGFGGEDGGVKSIALAKAGGAGNNAVLR